MSVSRWKLAASVCTALALTGFAMAETKVEVKGVHLCCGGCVKGVGSALKTVEGVTGKCDRDAETVTITAPDEATAQKALDALAAAGYHGQTNSQTLVIKSETNVPQGKVKTLTLTNIHNCCRACNKAIKESLKTVSGVSSDTAQPKMATIEVKGDFSAADVVKALNDAGFHVKIPG